MAKENNKTIITLVSVSVLVILAIAFLSSISDQTLLNTQKTAVSNESVSIASVNNIDGHDINETVVITLANAPTGWKATDSDCYISNLVLRNATGSTLTLTTDYIPTLSAGTFTLVNTTSTYSPTVNYTYADYEYCSDNYMADSWARSVLNTNVGLFVIAILIAVVLVVYLLFGKKGDED